jgi:hypothetical protein
MDVTAAVENSPPYASGLRPVARLTPKSDGIDGRIYHFGELLKRQKIRRHEK